MADKTLIHNAISKGIERAADAGITRTYDIALFVTVELNKRGLKVVNKPRKDGFIQKTVKRELNRTGKIGSKDRMAPLVDALTTVKKSISNA